MFTVEKDVPVVGDTKGGKSSKYPFNTMAVGDSFLVPNLVSGDGVSKVDRKVASSASQFARKNAGYKFKSATVEGGLRIWRVS